MAVFTNTRDLLQQKQSREFKKQTGWKKTAMAAMGYNDDGTKNTFGKYFGHGNVLMDSYIPGMLAKGSDGEEVIKSQRGAEWKKQIDVVKFIGNFVGGGAAGGAVGAGAGASAVGGGLAKTGSGLLSSSSSKTNILGNNISNFGQNTGTAFAGGGGAGNSSSQSMFKVGPGKDLVNDINLKTEQEELPDEDNYVQGDIEVDTPNEQEYNYESDATKVSKSTSKVTSSIPIAGEAAGIYTQQLAIADGLENAKKKIARQKRYTKGSNKRVA
mgnify:CR=1 FL=1